MLVIMKLYSTIYPRIGYDLMSNGKIKKWIQYHYWYLNKKRRVLQSYCDYTKYNITIRCTRDGFIIIKRFHDSESSSNCSNLIDGSKLSNRVWTRNHSIRRPTVKRFKSKTKTIISPCAKVKRMKYKLGSRFEFIRKKK